MHCGVTRVLAAAVLAAIVFAGLPATLLAQTPGPAATDLVDPPDTVYSTGGLANDPQVERGLPIIEHHRAFLPEQVDLSSRMPAVGDQGRLGSCTAWATAYAARSYYTEALERGTSSSRPTCRAPTTSITWPADKVATMARVSTTPSKYLDEVRYRSLTILTVTHACPGAGAAGRAGP